MEHLMERAKAVLQQLEAHGHYDLAAEFRTNVEEAIAHGETVLELMA
jgi:hypothetical protein